jgi:hypothetical protein
MLKVDEILFSKKPSEPLKHFNVLFNTNVDWDTDMVSVDVSYFALKENKILGENIINKNDKLVGVGTCDKTGKINVCHFDGSYQTYFWVEPSEVEGFKVIKENWEIEEVRRHNKAIKEKWTTEKSIKKELKKKRSNPK